MCTKNRSVFFVAFPWVVTSTGPGGFMVVCVFYDWNSQRLNRNWFYREAGNRTCDPWFTRHRFIPYTIKVIVCGRVPWLYQYWPGGLIYDFCGSMFRNLGRLNRQWFWF